MNKYTVMIEGHKTIFAKNEKEAFDFVDKQLNDLHPTLNLKTVAKL